MVICSESIINGLLGCAIHSAGTQQRTLSIDNVLCALHRECHKLIRVGISCQALNASAVHK